MCGGVSAFRQASDFGADHDDDCRGSFELGTGLWVVRRARVRARRRPGIRVRPTRSTLAPVPARLTARRRSAGCLRRTEAPTTPRPCGSLATAVDEVEHVGGETLGILKKEGMAGVRVSSPCYPCAFSRMRRIGAPWRCRSWQQVFTRGLACTAAWHAGESHMETLQRSYRRNRRSEPTNDATEAGSFGLCSCLGCSDVQMRLP